MTDTNSWGGSREGAGRPSLSDEDTVRKTITVPESVAEHLEEVGDGNASAGVRRLAAANMEEDSE
jgi:hypothetical protein